MKTLYLLIICTFIVVAGTAQSNYNSNGIIIPEKTPELEALYQKAKQIENTGTAAEINANRLATKNAWEQVSPEVAALYKPLPPVVEAPTLAERAIHPGSVQPITRSAADWGTDLLLREGFVDALSMDVAQNGDIYIVSAENYTGETVDDAEIFVFRSQDNGESFELWKNITAFDATVVKLQTIVMDGNGISYLLVYLLTDDGVFQAARWQLDTESYSYQAIASDVTGFGVDRNYPLNTSTQRVFGTYTKDLGNTTTELFSARSTAGSYGFDWVDEVNFGLYTSETAFAYGHGGSCYTTFVGGVDPHLFASVNPNFNDPASWVTPYEEFESTEMEHFSPTIRAARKPLASDNVVIMVSIRYAGSTNPLNIATYHRLNAAPYEHVTTISATQGREVDQPSTYVRRADNTEIIQTSHVRVTPDGTAENDNFVIPYDGNSLGTFESVSDNGVNVYSGYPAALAETADNLACMAFSGTDYIYGFDLYFDKKSTSVSVDENGLGSFNFYPNPAHETLTLSAANAIERITIYSLLGQKVMEFTPNQKKPSINISSLAPGAYTMKVEIDGRAESHKIIKE